LQLAQGNGEIDAKNIGYRMYTARGNSLSSMSNNF
jgi:hypothetical protein